MAERIKDRTMGIDDCTFLSKEVGILRIVVHISNVKIVRKKILSGAVS